MKRKVKICEINKRRNSLQRRIGQIGVPVCPELRARKKDQEDDVVVRSNGGTGVKLSLDNIDGAQVLQTCIHNRLRDEELFLLPNSNSNTQNCSEDKKGRKGALKRSINKEGRERRQGKRDNKKRNKR